jgi:hypothetical protein
VEDESQSICQKNLQELQNDQASWKRDGDLQGTQAQAASGLMCGLHCIENNRCDMYYVAPPLMATVGKPTTGEKTE